MEKLSTRHNDAIAQPTTMLERCMADEQTYEIFKKMADNTTVSVETVKGLEAGRSVLAALRNAKSNDEYYLFDPIAGTVIDPDQPSTSIDPLAS